MRPATEWRLPATASNLARVEELKRLAAQRVQKELGTAQELAGKLAGASVKIERQGGDESKMYGSVTAKDLEEAFAALGVEIDRKKIQLKEPLRQFGPFEVPIKLHASLSVPLKGEVVKKSS